VQERACFDDLEKIIAEGARQHDGPIFVPLPLADRDLVPLEVHIFHSNSTALDQPQPGSIHEPGHNAI